MGKRKIVDYRCSKCAFAYYDHGPEVPNYRRTMAALGVTTWEEAESKIDAGGAKFGTNESWEGQVCGNLAGRHHRGACSGVLELIPPDEPRYLVLAEAVKKTDGVITYHAFRAKICVSPHGPVADPGESESMWTTVTCINCTSKERAERVLVVAKEKMVDNPSTVEEWRNAIVEAIWYMD